MPHGELKGADATVIDVSFGNFPFVWNFHLKRALLDSMGESIQSCSDFQALIPAYRAGSLPEARALLLKDHLHECVACRTVFEGPKPARMPVRTQARMPVLRVIAAGIALAAVGVAAWVAVDWLILTPRGPNVVQSASGKLYRVWNQEIAAGGEIPLGAEIRTAKGSGAVVRLRDGSLVEVAERSGFCVSAAGKDLTVHLGQGGIIVQAAKRRSGHVYVVTKDCRVAATGTMFSVSSGPKGSRVSVIEGEVRVGEKVLHPGEQFSSSPSMTPVSVQEDVAWSRDLVREISVLQQKMELVRLPELRYSSRLLDLLPAQTAVYVSIPNLGKTVGDSHQVLLERLRESPVLREWWESQAKGKVNLEEMVAKFRNLCDYLGDEVVMGLTLNAAGKPGHPIFLAEVKRAGFREFLQSLVPGITNEMVLVRQNVVAVSPDVAALRKFGTGGFSGTPLHAHIAEAYREGAGLLIGADVQSMGTADLKHVLIEQKDIAGTTNTRATITFNGPRKGVAALLARPAPIGALEFVSPEATYAAAFAVTDPAGALDEAWKLQPMAKLALSPGELAGSLGANFAVALDGPLLPTPSWKLALEVYDPDRLQLAIRKLVETKQGAQLSQESVNGRTWHKLVIPDAKPWGEAHYVFVNGYLLAAPNRALLDRAIQYRSTGYTLPRSSGFQALVPRDRYTSFSGMVYYNSETKPALITMYGEPDRIIIATTASAFALNPAGLLGVLKLGATK